MIPLFSLLSSLQYLEFPNIQYSRPCLLSKLTQCQDHCARSPHTSLLFSIIWQLLDSVLSRTLCSLVVNFINQYWNWYQNTAFSLSLFQETSIYNISLLFCNNFQFTAPILCCLQSTIYYEALAPSQRPSSNQILNTPHPPDIPPTLPDIVSRIQSFLEN